MRRSAKDGGWCPRVISWPFAPGLPAFARTESVGAATPFRCVRAVCCRTKRFPAANPGPGSEGWVYGEVGRSEPWKWWRRADLYRHLSTIEKVELSDSIPQNVAARGRADEALTGHHPVQPANKPAEEALLDAFRMDGPDQHGRVRKR